MEAEVRAMTSEDHESHLVASSAMSKAILHVIATSHLKRTIQEATVVNMVAVTITLEVARVADIRILVAVAT